MGGGRRTAGTRVRARLLLGLVACWASAPVVAEVSWQLISETPAEVISIERSSLQRSGGRVSFRERHVFRDRKIDPGSLRPIREALVKRMVDCPGRRIATLSRAVFSDADVMINYRAVRPRHADWVALAEDDPVFRRVCDAL